MSEDSITQLARMIDHTILKPETTAAQVRQVCADALEYGFASVCANPTWLPLMVEMLSGSPVKVCTVAGFALGANLPQVKAYEAKVAVEMGAQEIDMVLNVGRLKDGEDAAVQADIAGVVAAAKGVRGETVVKVIIETALLTEAEKVRACQLVQAAGADFVKTATGFNGGGATVEDVALMRRTVGPQMGVKAAGGIRNGADAHAMIAAGANRLGTSAGVQIIRSARGEGTPEKIEGTY